ncbi:nitrate- and nitrite sensing domain-containing protein [Streptomyces sp. LP05-1]|uniref:histidine kinase n=1 Tax=Streptomyces pyxinae TaxID=2970734 RepID=A0ABT2CAE3_9ACTN|nr:nitrate- and nitrite sensing domain-containing protein [Streptomyces sp. LP05-1]MCS0634290.1 nitrate- and nitrite sensing domain-containing protein [Streptomyces sp. LP05-1]
MAKRSETPGDPQVPGGRRVRVRRRLVVGTALVVLTVLGAGAPAVLTASTELKDSQDLVTLAQLDRQAVTLAHSLSDERDRVTAWVAAGRNGKDKPRATAGATRVDRQIAEFTEFTASGEFTEGAGNAGNADTVPAELRHALAAVPTLRDTALTGKGSAMAAHRSYTEVIAGLQALGADLADRTPARATGTTPRATSDLGHAVEQASATRGLLLAALAVPGGDEKDEGRGGSRTVYDPATGTFVPADGSGTGGDAGATGGTDGTDGTGEGEESAAHVRDTLSAAAQQSRVREQAALAGFDQASTTARDALAATVTGPEVKAAEDYLGALTDRPELSSADRKTDPEKLDAALTARIEQMRGLESKLATDQVTRLEQLRDEDVTALEIAVALLGGCVLIAVAVVAAVARSLTRPLSVLRRGAARLAAEPEGAEPVRFTGRNDEFAEVVRSLNALHGTVAELSAEATRLDGERAAAVAGRKKLAAELQEQRTRSSDRAAELTTEVARLRDSVRHTFVNLSLRTLGLVERQLGVIERLEEREQDPERLATLFKLDHLATVMRRHSENLLVLAGHEHTHASQTPVPLVDVARAAVSEIERYERVTIQSLPSHAQVAGFAADDLSHLLAELLENATAFSPPDAKVQLSGWLLESGEIMLSVQDEGIGTSPERLVELNARLAAADPGAGDVPDALTGAGAAAGGEGLGLRVTALLAARHGVRVSLREQSSGGMTAVAVLPGSLLPKTPPAAVPPAAPAPGAVPGVTLPGSAAEANSNALPGRPGRGGAADDPAAAPAGGPATDAPGGDPLVAAAEAAFRTAEDGTADRSAGAATGTDGPETAPRTTADQAGTTANEAGRTADQADATADESVGTAVGTRTTADPTVRSAAGTGADARTGTDADADTETGPDMAVGPDTETGPDTIVGPDTEARPDTHPGTEASAGAATVAAGSEPAGRTAAGTGAADLDQDQEPGSYRDLDQEPDDSTRAGAPSPEHPETTLQFRVPSPAPAPEAAPAAAEAPEAPAVPHGRAPEPDAAGPAGPEHPAPESYVPAPHPLGTDGPDQAVAQEHPGDGALTDGAQSAGAPDAEEPDAGEPRFTDKGLPKRTPRVVSTGGPRPARTGGVDAEELRRRLGGFHRGARDGRRDAEAEIAQAETAQAGDSEAGDIQAGTARAGNDRAGRAAPAGETTRTTAQTTRRTEAVRTEDTGDTVEEARS